MNRVKWLITLFAAFIVSQTCNAQGNWTIFSKAKSNIFPIFPTVIYEDDQNNLWVGTISGLYMYDGINWNRFTKKEGLNNMGVTIIRQDSKGAVWIGTERGLSIYQNGKLSEITYGSLMHSFPITYISCIYEDSKENMWFGTGKVKSEPLYQSQGSLTKYDGVEITNIGLKMNSHPISEIIEDKNGAIWVASGWIYSNLQTHSDIYAGHLGRYQDENWEYYIDKIPYNGDWMIRGIYKDRSGNLWFSAISKQNYGCVIKYDGNEMSFFNRSNWLLNYVKVYYEDSNGIFWFGGNGGLVYQIDSEYRFLKNADNEMIPVNVNVIKEDANRNIWIGTSGGIYVYTGGEWKKFNIVNGLSGESNNVKMIAEDFEGKIWVLTREETFIKRRDYMSKINPENWSAETIPEDYFSDPRSFWDLYEDTNRDLWFFSRQQVMKYAQ
jgi:ligand-binding sensor domain-containing protein